MTRKKLKNLINEAKRLRGCSATARDLIVLAKALGRQPVKRGKEPTYESIAFRDLRPLSIPHHGGRDLAPGTKASILDQLDEDFNAWEMRLDE